MTVTTEEYQRASDRARAGRSPGSTQTDRARRERLRAIEREADARWWRPRAELVLALAVAATEAGSRT